MSPDDGNVNHGPLAGLHERSWPMVLLLQIVTLGIYGYVWFLRRAAVFNRLPGRKQINPGFMWGALLMYVASIVLNVASQVQAELNVLPAAPYKDIEGMLSFLQVVIYLHQSLTLRRMLKDYALNATRRPLSAGWLWTILFGAIHLQAVTNTLRDRLAESRA